MKCSESLVRPTGSAHAIGRRFVAVAATALLMLLPGALPAQVEGGPRDGGAWRAGDFWRFDRQFSLRLDDFAAGSIGTIVFNERFRKTVASPATSIATNGIDGPQRVYLRNRSAGSVTGDGIWFVPQGAMSDLASVSIQFTVLPGGTSSGFDWRRVSDLAEVRESFAVNGTIRARISSFTTLGTYYDNMNMLIAISATIDNGPALEFADFPLDQIGEEWNMVPTRRLSGSLTVGQEDMIHEFFTIPGTTITYPLDMTSSQTFIQNYAATGVTAPLLAGGTFPNNERIDAAGPGQGDTLHWSGTAKEFVDHTTGTGPVLTTLYGFRTSLSGTAAGTDYGVTPDGVISNIVFVPSRPVHGANFLVQFSGGPATLILRDHAGNEQTRPNASSPVLFTAPVADDDSPTSGVNLDLGSYGIEFIVGGHNVELATMRMTCPDCGTPLSTPTPSRTATPTPSRTPTTTPTASVCGTPLPPPVPIYPNQGAVNVPVDTNLTWNPIACSNFTVRLDPGISATTVICTGAASSCDPPGDLLPGTTYAWRFTSNSCVSPCGTTVSDSFNIVFTTAGTAPSPSPNPTASPSSSPPPSPPPGPTSSPSPVFPSPTPVCCPGDADNSGGSVNAQDFLAVQAAFGANNGTGGFGDADCSGGAVNAQDFLAVQANFGMSCG